MSSIDVIASLFSNSIIGFGQAREAAAAGHSIALDGFAGAPGVALHASVKKGPGSGTLTVLVEHSDDAGATWSTLHTFSDFTADGDAYAYAAAPNDLLRFRWTVVGATATFKVTGEAKILSKPAAAADVTGARDDPESALANLLTVLDSAGIITDSTTASA